MDLRSSELITQAERKAEKAESLGAFGGLKLLHIKRQVAEILNLVGRGGVFEEYTKHDISHLNTMLKSLDWIIPDPTKERMTATDWLLTVLSIYFHDVGMLVTKSEYNARYNSGFKIFKEQLFAGEDGAEYQAKISRLKDDEAEKFLYQEFVRHRHAERSRNWVSGKENPISGITPDIQETINSLLEPLGELFRRDLGIVCESHHLNDLGDVKKYKVRQAYGSSQDEFANIQYAAILLRTADLLHITSDRTPSVLLKAINPRDPVSQQEWAKQRAVKSVLPRLGTNADGNFDETSPKDTIQVFAYFTQEDGYFGLTSYLIYCGEQLRRSQEWASHSKKLAGVPYEFPWKFIDDSNIETEGFIKDTFEFSIDQAKVLELLTGHTLYNDTRVVLRELVQNSLDAIRLQHHPRRPDGGLIKITWSNHSRELAVQDNGTGMTQEIINRFLLKVGSSRYQDPEFRKKYPSFNSISRFGIGVLSAFMIADSLEIITSHPEEEQARRITLRSVHGKYLIRLLDKGQPEAKQIGPHGSIFKLKMRSKVDIGDVVALARHWLVVSDCRVEVIVDDKDPVAVGASSTRLALVNILQQGGMFVDDQSETTMPLTLHNGRLIRVVEKVVDGLSLAFAVEWNPYYKLWSFIRGPRDRGDQSELSKAFGLLSTSVEGIRVESGCPGMRSSGIFALANAYGETAPKTNVARSGLEATDQRDAMLQKIYSALGNHVVSELEAMHKDRGLSLTWAAQEAQYVLQAIPTGEEHLISKPIFEGVLKNLRLHLVEIQNARRTMSVNELLSLTSVWTIDCSLLRSAEYMIREVQSSSSISVLAEALGVSVITAADDALLCESGLRNRSCEEVLVEREVSEIRITESDRRVDLKWIRAGASPRWKHSELFGIPSWAIARGSRSPIRLYVPIRGVDVSSPRNFSAVKTHGSIFLLPENEISEAISTSFDKLIVKERFTDDPIASLTIVSLLRSIAFRGRIENPMAFLKQCVTQFTMETALRNSLETRRLVDDMDLAPLAQMVSRKGEMFDSSAWSRMGADNEEW